MCLISPFELHTRCPPQNSPGVRRSAFILRLAASNDPAALSPPPPQISGLPEVTPSAVDTYFRTPYPRSPSPLPSGTCPPPLWSMTETTGCIERWNFHKLTENPSGLPGNVSLVWLVLSLGLHWVWMNSSLFPLPLFSPVSIFNERVTCLRHFPNPSPALPSRMIPMPERIAMFWNGHSFPPAVSDHPWCYLAPKTPPSPSPNPIPNPPSPALVRQVILLKRGRSPRIGYHRPQTPSQVFPASTTLRQSTLSTMGIPSRPKGCLPGRLLNVLYSFP